MGRDKVIVDTVRETEIINEDWPSGALILNTLKAKSIDLMDHQQNPDYWQVSARLALLQSYSMLSSDSLESSEYKIDNSGTRYLCFSESDSRMIQERWKALLDTSASESSSNDLGELIQTKTSNSRPLKWTFMDCAPGCQFNLHAHPNIELVYCCRGALYEVRMEGEPVDRNFQREAEVGSDRLVGPDMRDSSRSWYFGTLHQGCWLVNEVGSVHKSFTSTSGEGCVLLVLWGGSHADVPSNLAPQRVNVEAAVDKMDQRLQTCGCGKNAEELEETFLPESERSL